MSKRYQNNEFDANAAAVPEQVSVAMDEIAADMREGLLALAVGTGLQVMQQLMVEDVTAVCGPKRNRHELTVSPSSRHGIRLATDPAPTSRAEATWERASRTRRAGEPRPYPRRAT